MANHLHTLLAQWHPARDELRWVLATVVMVEGSNYRSIGAMMLANELGKYYGLISGGCLERSLMLQVKKVLTYGQSITVEFDSSESSESPWAIALGCGGKVTILLQCVDAANHYQQLDLLYSALKNRVPVRYGICLTLNKNSAFSTNYLFTEAEAQAASADAASRSPFIMRGGRDLLVIPVRAQIHLAVFGGGMDAVPLVQMADILGWRVTLVDARSGYAQSNYFASAEIICASVNSAEVKEIISSIDAAIIMTHNLKLDAAAISELQNSSARYIGLLGPSHRKQKVLNLAGISQSTIPIYGPMGLRIGGELPESIALSVLAQCHQVLEQSSGADKMEVHPSLIPVGELA